MARRIRTALQLTRLEQRDTPATYRGSAFVDANANGGQDSGEPALAGLVIELDANSDGPTDARTTTDANGVYEIANIPDGVHRLTAIALEGYTFVSQPSRGLVYRDGILQPTPVPLLPFAPPVAGRLSFGLPYPFGLTDPDRFALMKTGYVIAGAFFDDNANRTQEIGTERVTDGVTIRITSGPGNTVGRTAETANGNVVFSDLPDGDYILSVVPPNVMAVTTSRDLFVSIRGGVNTNPAENLIAFGLATAQVSGRVFFDANANGTQDSDETGIFLSRIQILQNDALVKSQETDVEGRFIISGLTDGVYTFRIGQAPIPTLPGFRSEQIYPPDQRILIENGRLVGTLKTAVLPSGGIRGRVFEDTNGDGRWNPGEAGIAGIRLELDTNNDSFADKATTTDKSGEYSFPNLVTGDYRVRVVYPTGYRRTNNTPLLQGATIRSGILANGADFGLNPTTSGTNFAGTVFVDHNGNGRRDANDESLGSVTLTFGNQTAVTDRDGVFRFNDLSPGTDQLSIGTLPGYTTNPPTTVVVKATENADVAVAVRPNGAALVQGIVLSDRNENQQADAGEKPIVGYPIQLFRASFQPGLGVVFQDRSATYRVRMIGSGGMFHFSDVPDGTYRLVMDPGPVSSGTADVTIVNGQVTSGPITVLVPPTQLPTQIQVFQDYDGDGLYSPRFDLLDTQAIVKVNINGLPDTPSSTQTTDSSGRATFALLPDGQHTVTLNDPLAVLSTPETWLNVLDGFNTAGTVMLGYRYPGKGRFIDTR
ncbi:MAG: SdrD B-like domain-containing protein, partial [Gemmataceae bacterium]